MKKLSDVLLPTGKPFQSITPEESLKRITESKARKLEKETQFINSYKKKSVKNPKTMYSGNCKKCGKPFFTNYKMQKYCSPACRELGTFFKNAYLTTDYSKV